MTYNKIFSQHNELNFDCIVVGAGFAGAVIARELAERRSKRVLLLEKSEHIGGNAYDCLDDNGLFIHKYGPHIFHTSSRRVYDYLSRFTEWRYYQHRVLANIYGKLVPVPFNLKSLPLVFKETKAARFRRKLIDNYSSETKVSILDLKKQPDSDLRELAEYVYQNIFLHYTQKQWGTRPEDIDPAVTARVPVFISEDDRYFQDAYQGIPLDGYTALFKKMLDHPNITAKLNVDARKILAFENSKVTFLGDPFNGILVYTGALDELFDFCFGHLPYRTLKFELETYNVEWKQPCATINYTVDQLYTRTTEFKHLTGQICKDKTTIMKEFPLEYLGADGETPFYPIANTTSYCLYNQYF